MFVRGIEASVLLLFLAVAGGCASKPARFYTLNSCIAAEVPVETARADSGFIMVVGPVSVPGYLDHPQIVSWTGQNELKLSQNDRWAGSLESDIARVLVDNLSAFLSKENVTVLRWEPSAQAQFPFKYRINVEVTRFEGAPGGPVLLKARWSIFSQNRSLLLAKESSGSGQVDGNSYDALVAAMSKALEGLSREVAGAVTNLSRMTGK